MCSGREAFPSTNPLSYPLVSIFPNPILFLPREHPCEPSVSSRSIDHHAPASFRHHTSTCPPLAASRALAAAPRELPSAHPQPASEGCRVSGATTAAPPRASIDVPPHTLPPVASTYHRRRPVPTLGPIYAASGLPSSFSTSSPRQFQHTGNPVAHLLTPRGCPQLWPLKGSGHGCYDGDAVFGRQSDCLSPSATMSAASSARRCSKWLLRVLQAYIDDAAYWRPAVLPPVMEMSATSVASNGVGRYFQRLQRPWYHRAEPKLIFAAYFFLFFYIDVFGMLHCFFFHLIHAGQSCWNNVTIAQKIDTNKLFFASLKHLPERIFDFCYNNTIFLLRTKLFWTGLGGAPRACAFWEMAHAAPTPLFSMHLKF